MYVEYGKIDSFMRSLTPGYRCPTCFHEVTSDNAEVTSSQLQILAAERVSAGKKAKSDLAVLKARDVSERETFAKIKSDEILIFDNLLIDFRGQLQAADVERQNDEEHWREALKALNNEIQEVEYRRANGNLSVEQLSRLSQLYQAKREWELQIGLLTEAVNKPDPEETITWLNDDITRLNILVNGALLYVGKKNELLFSALQMNKARVSLYDVVKSTGEIKDTFKFTFDGRDYRRLSLSEKIRAGLELAELIKRLSGRNYPTFVDNSESICVIDNVRPVSQMIFSVVAKGKPLAVVAKETSLRKAG